MKQRLNFITGIVMLVVAGTLVFMVTSMEVDSVPGREAHASEGRERDARGQKRLLTARRPARPAAGFGPFEVGLGRVTAAAGGAKPGQLRSDLRIEVDRTKFQSRDLAQRAERVESFALRRLKMLAEQLDLTAEQQARIFPILVRGSQSYDPRMRIVTGAYAGLLEPELPSRSDDRLGKPQEQELIQEQLNPAQSDELIDRSIKDLLIWEEIISGLTHQLDQAVPGKVEDLPVGASPEPDIEEVPVEVVPLPEADPVAPLDSHGGRNIFLQQVPDN